MNGVIKTLLKTIGVFLLVMSFAGCANPTSENKSKVKEVETENRVPTCISDKVWEGKTEVNACVSDVYKNRYCIVTIISDDGRYDSGVNLNRILGERGLTGTVAGVVDIVRKDLAAWTLLLEDGNIDMVSHSYSHEKMADDCEIANDISALEHQIADADRWYEKELGYEQIAFVCPENQMCANGYDILSENGFWAVRRGKRGYNSVSPEEGTERGQWFNLMVQGICDEGVDTEVRNGWVDTAEKDGTWLIEMWHNVMPEDDGMYQTILLPEAEEHLDYIKTQKDAGKIWVATYTEAVKYIREKQNCKPHVFLENNELHVLVELEREDMNYSTFNQPLTVILEMPDTIVLSDNEEQCTRLSDRMIMVDAVPGIEKIITLSES